MTDRPNFKNKQPIKFTLDGGKRYYTGTIIGRAFSTADVDFWIVLLAEAVPDYEYSAILLQHYFIQPYDTYYGVRNEN